MCRSSFSPSQPSASRFAPSMTLAVEVVRMIPERRPGVAALSRPRLD